MTFDDKLFFASILDQSCSAPGDHDAAGAVEIENAAVGFMDHEFKWSANSSLRADVLDRLKALDVRCHSQNGSAATGMQIVKCMEDIGLDSVLWTYIHGMVANQDGGSFHALSPVEQSSLRYRWFHGYMTSMQWNEDFFNDHETTVFPPKFVDWTVVEKGLITLLGFVVGVEILSCFPARVFGLDGIGERTHNP